MEVFVEAAQFINIVPVQCVIQPIDAKVVTKMVTQGQKVIVNLSLPVRGEVIISVPVMIVIAKEMMNMICHCAG